MFIFHCSLLLLSWYRNKGRFWTATTFSSLFSFLLLLSGLLEEKLQISGGFHCVGWLADGETGGHNNKTWNLFSFVSISSTFQKSLCWTVRKVKIATSVENLEVGRDIYLQLWYSGAAKRAAEMRESYWAVAVRDTVGVEHFTIQYILTLYYSALHWIPAQTAFPHLETFLVEFFRPAGQERRRNDIRNSLCCRSSRPNIDTWRREDSIPAAEGILTNLAWEGGCQHSWKSLHRALRQTDRNAVQDLSNISDEMKRRWKTVNNFFGQVCLQVLGKPSGKWKALCFYQCFVRYFLAAGSSVQDGRNILNPTIRWNIISSNCN